MRGTAAPTGQRASQAAKKRKIRDDNYLLRPVLQFLGVEEEQQGRPGDLQRLQPSFPYQEDLPVSGEDQSNSGRAEDSGEELEEEVTDSEGDGLTTDGVHLWQFWRGVKGSGYS